MCLPVFRHKKQCLVISANVCVYAMFTDGRILSPSVNMGELEKRAAYTLLYDVWLSTYLVTVP